MARMLQVALLLLAITVSIISASFFSSSKIRIPSPPDGKHGSYLSRFIPSQDQINKKVYSGPYDPHNGPPYGPDHGPFEVPYSGPYGPDGAYGPGYQDQRNNWNIVTIMIDEHNH